MYKKLKLVESAKLTEADEEELEDRIDDLEDTIETNDDLQDTVDSEEEQDENPVEEESELDTKLDELREVLVDLDLNLYRVASKEDPNNVIYIIGKVAEESNDTLMLIDTKPEEVNQEEIEEPIINNIEESAKLNESMPDDWYNEMRSKYVPKEGEAETIGGEILRLFSKVSYHFYQNGDKIWRDNMKNNSLALDPVADSLFELLPKEGQTIMEDMANAGKYSQFSSYKKGLAALEDFVYNYLKDNPSLFETNNKLQESEEIIEEPSEEEIKSELESRFDFVVLPKTFDEINKLGPRYGEDLTPDHEAIMEYLMNCLIEVNPEAAEELQNKELETAEEIPAEPVEDLELDIGLEGEEELEDEE